MRQKRKKWIAIVVAAAMAASMTFGVASPNVSAITLDEMTTISVQLVTANEGTYGSVNPNDCGAVSVGILQWHANRALSLMRTIASADTSYAISVLDETFYNEIMSVSDWSSRTFNAAETAAASTLLASPAGISAQDSLAYSDVQGYVCAGQNCGLTDPAAIMYYTVLYNRGSGVAARIVTSAKNSVGSVEAVTLDVLHRAALSDSSNSSGYYTTALNNTYNALVGYSCGVVGTTIEETDTVVEESVSVTVTVDTSYVGEYVVTASTLNVRSAPSTSATTIGQLTYGTVVTVIAAGEGWAEIAYGDVNAFVSMSYLESISTDTAEETEPDPESETTDSDLAAGEYITTSSVNVRAAATMSSDILGVLAEGQLVTVNSVENGWAEIEYGDGIAYVSADYLGIAPEITEEPEPKLTESTESDLAAGEYIATSSVNVRAAATTSSDILGVLAEGQLVTVNSVENGWAEIEYGDGIAYVSADYLGIAPEITEEPEPELTESTEPEPVMETETVEAVESSTDIPVYGVSDPVYADVYGDVNGDGTVSLTDAVTLQRYLNGSTTLDVRALANADCSRDDTLDTRDVTAILQYLIEKIPALPIV